MYTIFYFTGGKDPREIASSIGTEAHTRWAPGGELLALREVEGRDLGVEYRFIFHSRPSSARRAVVEAKPDILIVDARKASSDAQPVPFAETMAAAFVEALVGEDAPSPHAVRKSQIAVVVDDDPLVGDNAYHVGSGRLAGCLVDPVRKKNLLFMLDSFLKHEKGGKVAICLAGGGVEGLIYEIGVLMAIDAIMIDRSVNDFDIFCGISCGSMINSFLANGVTLDEMALGLQSGKGRIDKISRSVIFRPNV